MVHIKKLGDFMISERLQRVMMGIMLMIILYLYNTQEMALANYLMGFMIGMISIWAVFDFCPSLWTFKKVFKEECKKC